MGGRVFTGGSDKIAKEDIRPTLDAWIKEIIWIFPKSEEYFGDPAILGSAGKKDFSGDIDIAVDDKCLNFLSIWNLDIEELRASYNKMLARARTATSHDVFRRAVIQGIAEKINKESSIIVTSAKSSGSGILFSEFGQIDHITGKPNGLTVQIDTNFGNIEWLKFAYYSDSYQGNVKGLHRTQLMLHMFVYKGFMFKHNKGVMDPESRDIVASTPNEAIEFLNKLYDIHIDRDILSNYHKLQEYLKNHIDIKDLHGIWDIYLKTLDSTRCDIPEDLQQYWLENRDRLGLTGKFLPEDSTLSEVRMI